MKKKILKLSSLCFLIAIINILAFSKAFFGISIYSDNLIAKTFSIFIPIASVFAFLYGGNEILDKKEKIGYYVDVNELENSEDYMVALRKNAKKLPFLAKELNMFSEQIQRIERKYDALVELLKQDNKQDKFLVNEAENAKSFLLSNVKRGLRTCILINAMDKDESTADGRNVCKEQIKELEKIIDANERNLDEFDLFLEEVSKMGEKPLQDNLSLQCTIKAMRQIRGVDSTNIIFKEESL